MSPDMMDEFNDGRKFRVFPSYNGHIWMSASEELYGEIKTVSVRMTNDAAVAVAHEIMRLARVYT
jgi:hypothetical protein